MEIQPWVLWVVATLLAVFIPTGIIGMFRMFEKDGEDGDSVLVRELLTYDWCDYLNEEEVLVLATLIARADMRQIYGKDIDSII